MPSPFTRTRPQKVAPANNLNSIANASVPNTATTPNEETSGIGLSNSNLSQDRRRMLDLINRLHNTGVQVDIDLPQIAVIGSQSAGKSSLIESISGITLPRAAGTCTRCPTEVRLTRSDLPWQCVVRIRILTNAQGKPIGQASNETFGDTIYDKLSVEDRIRRAQKAILNPSKDMKRFLHDVDGQGSASDSELSFSTNCVSLEISGPDVSDLSFVDLPGLIASVGSNSKGGENDIALVESLVTSYIKKPNCIILLTIACETDFENQGAHRMAKQHDPHGKRTIGVLTKPDRIPTGEESNWLQFIMNTKEPLLNNWFCVKQPSSNDLKSTSTVTWSEARRREEDFFSKTAPWCDLDVVYKKFLKVGNLVEKLSIILGDLIARSLPEISEELQKNINKVRAALASLPPPPTDNPQAKIAMLLHNFISDVEKHIEGVPEPHGLLQAIRPAQEKFKRAIRVTAPDFRPYEKRYEGKNSMSKETFLLKEEGNIWGEEVVDVEYSPDLIAYASESEGETTRPQSSLSANVDRETQDSSAHVYESMPQVACTPEKGYISKRIYVDEVMKRAEQAITRELPLRYPFFVQKTYVDVFVKEWNSPAMALSASVYGTVSDYMVKLVKLHFASFGKGLLEKRVRAIIRDHVERCKASADTKISWLLKLESRIFTLNTHYFSDYQSKFFNYFKAERYRNKNSRLIEAISQYQQGNNGRNHNGEDINVAKVMSGLRQIGLNDVKPDDLHKLPGGDQMEPALIIMADVRAYFQVAYKRFVDNIPSAIDGELVSGVKENLLAALYDNLRINTSDGHEICKKLAEESAYIANERVDLNGKLERLELAQKELMDIV